MMEHDRGRAAPWSLLAVGVFALLWNGLGTLAWATTAFLPGAALEGLPAAHRAYVAGLPAWSTLTWALGVLGGLAGSILLLLRRRLAVAAFALSLLGAVTNSMVYVTDPPPDGFFNLPLTLFIIAFAAFELWFADRMKRRSLL
jgi:uncharacterized membrane protein